MPDDAYRDLLVRLTRLTGLADHFDDLHDKGALIVHGVAFTMHRGASVVGGPCDRVEMFADFGAFPEARSTDVMRRLLEVNLLLSSTGTARLGMDADTGRVVLAYHQVLGGLTAERLLESLHLAARQALEWRANFYLDDRRQMHGVVPDAILV